MRTLLAATALLGVACAGRGAPIAVEGPAPDVVVIVGDWAGSFESENGRAGTIHFHLASVGDTAWGDLQMMPAEAHADREPMDRRPTMAPAPLIMTIRFVQVARDRVRGMLDPYRDPVCGCRVTTVFEGTVRGDVIAGEYVTRHAEHAREVRGTWRVSRLPARN